VFDTSVIELSRRALKRNFRFMRKRLGPHPVISCVIKGNAYGHGIESFLPMAEQCGVEHFSVFSASEAVRAVQSRTSDSTHVMVMGHMEGEAIPWAIERGVSFYVFDLERLEAARRAAAGAGRTALIHLEVETGLNRTGLAGEDLDRALSMLADNRPHLALAGVCTHYAGAESVNNYLRIQEQKKRYRRALERVRAAGLEPGLRHTACSAAALTYPETVMDMVRTGIAMYGFWPSKQTKMHYIRNCCQTPAQRRANPLRRVMRWKSSVMSLKSVRAGEFIGYGTTCLATRDRVLASVPVGYFHGFARSLSNLGYVLIHGRRANVAGLVNMNALLVDVTDLNGRVGRGDEVVLIGRQKRAHISVSSFSDMTRNPNYEVLTRLPACIPRVVVD
jgi:alanine racemase